jgi:hypothetical protein
LLQVVEKRESVTVLEECIKLQEAKGSDYQSKLSSVRQADYYLRGVESIYDMLHTKMLRVRSLMEAAKAQHGARPNHESLEDSLKDLINYASFAVSYVRGKMDGQVSGRDIFNRSVGALNDPTQTQWGTLTQAPTSLPTAAYNNSTVGGGGPDQQYAYCQFLRDERTLLNERDTPDHDRLED